METTGQTPFGRPAQRAGSPQLTPSAPASPAPVAGSTTMTADHRKALEGQRRNGGQWFYWVAALSLINTALAFSGQQWRFILGLGITQLVQELAQQSGGAGMKAGLVGLAVIGLFAFLGQRAVVGHSWAFLVGMILYALDGLIFLLVQDWPGVGFHVFALVMIMRGYLAARRLSAASA